MDQTTTTTPFSTINNNTYATVTIDKKLKKVLVFTRKDPEKLTVRFKALFKNRTINTLPENSPIVFNEHTRRFVKREVMYTQRGTLRAKFARRVVYSNVVNYTAYFFEERAHTEEETLENQIRGVSRNQQVVFTSTKPFVMSANNLVVTNFFGSKDPLVRRFLNKPTIPIIHLQTNQEHEESVYNTRRLYNNLTNNRFDELPFEERIFHKNAYPFITEITSYNSTNIVQGDLDLRTVRMYNSSVSIDNIHITKNFQDKGDMCCVPETLWYKYCDKTKPGRNLHLDITGICQAMADPDEPVKNPDDGFTVNDLEKFCRRFRIPMYALDIHERLFHSYYPESRNKKCNALCYIVANSHLYLCEDKAFVNRVNSFAKPTTSSSSSLMNETPVTEIKELVLDESNVIYQEDSLDELFMKFYKEDNTLISPTNCYFQDGRIKRMTSDLQGVTYYANKDLELVQKYIQEYNNFSETPIVFTNQSVLGLGRQIFCGLYPEHKKSIFNQQVFETFPVNANLVRTYNHPKNEANLTGIDINKCRTSCLRDNVLGEYKRYTVMDSIEPYGEKINKLLLPGFYYILTTNQLPCKGNGWYSDGFLKYLDQEVIEYTIKYQLLSSFVYDNDYMVRFFEEIVQLDNFKFVSNGTIGSLAMRRKTSSRVYFETNFQTACAHYFNFDGSKKSNSQVYITPMDNEKTLYKIEDRTNHIELDSDIPIYNQILENEWVKCYELYKKMGGRLIAIKTDNVIVEGMEFRDLELTDEIGGFKTGDIHLPVNDPKSDKEEVEMMFGDWKTDQEQDFEGFAEIAKHIIDKDQSCNIIGSAGVGKSYLIKNIVDVLNERGKKYAILAPTNKAALNIGGMTIHKFLGMDHTQKIRKNMLRKLRSYDYIILDELSMVGSLIYNQLNLAKKQSEKIKFLLIGDFKQLPPVKDDEYDYENTRILKQLCDYNRFELTINKRSDDVMWDIAAHAYNTGSIEPFTFGKHSTWESERHLCHTNRTRKGINEYIMQSKKEPGLFIECFDKDLEVNEYAQSIVLHVGTPIMSCKNNKKEDILNNQEFTVTGWNDQVIHTHSMDIKILDFQKMFVVAYATTVHKAQGATFDFKFSIWETSRMDHRMLYTAVTRTTNKDLICIVKSTRELPFVKMAPKQTTVREDYDKGFVTKKLNGYKQQDKMKTREFDLDVSDFQKLVHDEKNACHFCGNDLGRVNITIDRINNQLGHIRGNCRLACLTCNRKHGKTIE